MSNNYIGGSGLVDRVDFKYTLTGSPVLNFCISEGVEEDDGKVELQYTHCSVFGKKAESWKGLKNGDAVLVTGRLEMRKYLEESQLGKDTQGIKVAEMHAMVIDPSEIRYSYSKHPYLPSSNMRVRLIGRLSKDIRVKTLPSSGVEFAAASLPIDESWMDRYGDWTNLTSTFTPTWWHVDQPVSGLRKGDRIHLEGVPRYMTSLIDGEPRHHYYIEVLNWKLLGQKT